MKEVYTGRLLSRRQGTGILGGLGHWSLVKLTTLPLAFRAMRQVSSSESIQKWLRPNKVSLQMKPFLTIKTNLSSDLNVKELLRRCDDSFVPRLSSRVKIGDYACKIISNAIRFEAWRDFELVGMVAAYCNNSDRDCAFITNVSVLPDYRGQGVASKLITLCLAHVEIERFRRAELVVHSANRSAISLYKKHGFLVVQVNDMAVTMSFSVK